MKCVTHFLRKSRKGVNYKPYSSKLFFGEKDFIVFAIHDVANDYENIVTIFNLVWHTIQGSVFLATLVALHFTPVSH